MTISKTSTITVKQGFVATQGLRFKNRATTTGIVIHCSATKPSQNFDAQAIDRMHRVRGFLCIGYQAVIRRDGVVELGRPWDAEGSHCIDGGRNKTTVGICLIGGVSENPLSHRPGWPWNGSDSEMNFTAAQQEALPLLIDLIKQRYANIKTIEGHREVPGVKKACPSMSVQHWLKTGEFKN